MGTKTWDVWFITYLHLVQSVKMSGAELLTQLYI